MFQLVKKLSLTLSVATLVVVVGYGSAPSQLSFAALSPATISARVTALSGLAPEDISEMYVVEQSAKIVIIAGDINIPIVVEPKIGYLLIKNATTGLWIRVIIDLAEWNADFRPYFEENGIEIHGQPFSTIGTLTAGAEAAQIAVVAVMTGIVVADWVQNGSPNVVPGESETPAPSNDPGPSLTSDQIGTTEGSFRVDESGSATYSIPISAAAGTAGVAPTISLNYSSASRNGIAGMGWSLGGLSAISRCRQTLEQDRNAMSINWTSSDRFCLDGQRLFLNSGSSYGSAGSTYRTEIDSGAIVTVVGSVNGEPDYFEVSREDGSTSYYGRTAVNSDESAKLKGGVNTLTWGIRQFKDSVGNSIWFDYEIAATTLRVKDIRYAFGSSDGPTGDNARINFVYQSRTDDITGYVGGYKFASDKRLTNILAYNRMGGIESLIRDYVIRYDEGQTVATDGLSRLTSVQECANGACLPKTTFDWILPSVSTFFTTVGSLTMGSNYSSYTLADINGDSMTDMVWFEGTGSTRSLRFAMSTGSGLAIKPFSNGSTSLSLPVSVHPRKVQSIDFNMDGRQDIAYYDSNALTWKVVMAEPFGDGEWRLSATPVSTGITFSVSQIPNVLFMDVDSNGTTDAVYRSGSQSDVLTIRLLKRDTGQLDSSSTAYHFETPFTPAGSQTSTMIGHILPVRSDFDGDGQVDLVISGVDYECDVEAGQWSCGTVSNNRRAVLMQGVAAGSPSVSSYYNFPVSGGQPQMNGWQSVDINVDGIVDAFYPFGPGSTGTRTKYVLRLNRGNGVFDEYAVSDSSLLDDVARPAFADWNMDGYPDLLWKDKNGVGSIKARYWNPDTEQFDAAVNIAFGASTNTTEFALYVDANGDAVTDILYLNRSGTVGSVEIHARPLSGTTSNIAANRIEQITSGLGAKTNITYEALTTTTHYDRLELTTSTGTSTFCEAEPGLPPFCYDAPIQVPNQGEFYTAINADWDLPGAAQVLGKNSPIMEIVGPVYVVTNVSGDAPSAGALPNQVNTNAQSSISYRYGEAKLQAGGRGFLGFERLTTIDSQTDVETTTRYRQDWPFIGRPMATEVRSISGYLLSSSTTDWQIKEWSANYQSTYQASGSAVAGPIHVVQAKSNEKTYDLLNGGAGQGVLLSEVITLTGHDTEANVTSITVDNRDGSGTSVKSVATMNVFDSTTFPLREGRLTNTTVTTTRQGQTAPLVRKSSFTYYPTGPQRGLLETETVEPDNAMYTLTTTHSYDNFGNRDRSKVVADNLTRCDVDTVVYDVATGRYVDTERDCLGRAFRSVTLRNAFGQPLAVDSYVGTSDVVTSTTSYGALGRPYYSYAPTGAATTSFFDASTSNCPTGTAFKSTATDTGGAQTAACIDRLGRTIRTLSTAFDGTWVLPRYHGRLS